MLGGKAGAWPHLGLIAGRQRDGQSCRHLGVFSRRQDQRRFLGHSRQQIKPGSVCALIRGQRQALAMRQLADVDFHGSAHELFSTVLAIFAISSVATCPLVITGQESTLMLSTPISVPSRVNRCTVLRSPPITPDADDTSLATIQSQPLRLIFALALSIRCSVSAAKPITSGGRLSPSFATVARMSGFSTSCSGGMPADVFFIFCSPSLTTRQSAT